jgi:hypothetical protein
MILLRLKHAFRPPHIMLDNVRGGNDENKAPGESANPWIAATESPHPRRGSRNKVTGESANPWVFRRLST